MLKWAVLWLIIYNITLLLCFFWLIVIKYLFCLKVTRRKIMPVTAGDKYGGVAGVSPAEGGSVRLAQGVALRKSLGVLLRKTPHIS
jgi:hypothetical protein